MFDLKSCQGALFPSRAIKLVRPFNTPDLICCTLSYKPRIGSQAVNLLILRRKSYSRISVAGLCSGHLLPLHKRPLSILHTEDWILWNDTHEQR
jgi:hypothetical protein